MAKNNYNVKVSLSDQQLKAAMVGFLEVKDGDVIQALAQELVCKVADGGMIIPAPVIARIEKVLDKLDDPMEIAEAVEAGAGRNGDNIVVRMDMDPIWVGPLKEKAIACGLTVDTLASELQSQILNGGMLVNMPTETLPVYLTPQQHAWIKSQMGLNESAPLFGDNLARYFGWGREEVVPIEELFAVKG